MGSVSIFLFDFSLFLLLLVSLKLTQTQTLTQTDTHIHTLPHTLTLLPSLEFSGRIQHHKHRPLRGWPRSTRVKVPATATSKPPHTEIMVSKGLVKSDYLILPFLGRLPKLFL